MKIKTIAYTLIATAILTMSSCEDEYSKFSVSNATLKSYLNKFIEEAKSRGVTDLAPEVTGLKMYFGDCKEGAAGVTYYENPIRIVIDEEIWNTYSKYSDGESQNEHTVFHELAHGLLYREHDNDTLSNGEWATMMAGEPIPDGFIPNTNFRGERRTYYLDRLFNPRLKDEPTWTKPSFDDPTSELTEIIHDDFTTTSGFNKEHWEVSKSSDYSVTTSTGEYIFKNNSSKNYLIPIENITASNAGDVYMEASIKATTGNTSSVLWFILGQKTQSSSNTTYNYHYMAFRGTRIRIGNSKCYAAYCQINSPKSPIGNDYVKIGIRKTENNIYYFINDNCIYKDTVDTKMGGTLYGFTVPQNTTLYMTDFQIWNDGTTSTYKSSEEAERPKAIYIEERKQLKK